MTISQLMPWIGGPVKFDAGFSPLLCPIDDSIASQMIESDAAVVDAAVKHAHDAFLKHQAATTAKRVEWLLAAADAIDKIEGELVRSLIRFIGKPRRAATFEAKRVGTFMRACAAQLPHLMGEVLPLDVTAAGAGRFGFTTRVPYGVVAAVTPFNGPANLLIQKVAPALAVGNAIVVKPSPPGTEVALLMAQAMKAAGIPDGLFNVVPGGRETARLLAAHPLVAVVTVTVSSAAADRVEEMVKDAVAKGGKLVLKPERRGAILGPAIVADAPPQARLMREEAFGPVVVVQNVGDVDAALELANSSEFGLQGACFTTSLETAFKVSRKLRVGSLWINDASRFRLDTYPFGGVGASGFGREGVRYAMEELSQWKFTGMRLNPR